MRRWDAFEVGWVVIMIGLAVSMIIGEIKRAPNDSSGCSVHVSTSTPDGGK